MAGTEAWASTPDAEVRRAHDGGAGESVVVDAVHRTDTDVLRLCRVLEARLGCIVGANAYRTPPESRAFPPHYDTQDVVVLQLAGRKRWRLFDAAVPQPTRRQPCPSGGVAPGPARWEGVLEPGDLLHVPRGMVHVAETDPAGGSEHLSLGIVPWTRSELIAAGTDRVPAGGGEAVWLDPTLPDGGLPPAERDRLRAAGVVDVDGAVDRVLGEFVASRAPLPPQNATAGPDTPVVRSDTACFRGRLVDDVLWLQVPGDVLRLPAAAGPAVAVLLSGRPTTAASLPDVPDLQAGMDLTHTLAALGLVEVSVGLETSPHP